MRLDPPGAVLIAVAAVGLLNLAGLFDALRRPRAAWLRSGQSRSLWVTLLTAGTLLPVAWFLTPVSLFTAIAWWGAARPLVPAMASLAPSRSAPAAPARH